MDFPPCAHGCGEHHQHHDTGTLCPLRPTLRLTMTVLYLDPSLQGYWVPHYALDMSLNHG